MNYKGNWQAGAAGFESMLARIMMFTVIRAIGLYLAGIGTDPAWPALV